MPHSLPIQKVVAPKRMAAWGQILSISLKGQEVGFVPFPDVADYPVRRDLVSDIASQLIVGKHLAKLRKLLWSLFRCGVIGDGNDR